MFFKRFLIKKEQMNTVVVRNNIQSLKLIIALITVGGIVLNSTEQAMSICMRKTNI